MFWHFMLNFGRSLRANKALTLINVISLALGLTVFGIASLYVQRELSYDQGWPNAERIHRVVVQRQGLPGSPDGVSTAVDPRSYQLLLDNFSEQIEASTRQVSIPVQVQVGETKDAINFLTLVDPSFADIFPLEVSEGSLTRVLENPGLIALSEDRADVLGDAGRVGQRLLVSAPYGGGEQEFEVGAIIRVPELTAVPIDMLTVISEHAAALAAPWESSTAIRLLLKPGVGTEEFNEQMPSFVEGVLAVDNSALQIDGISEHLFYKLQPVHEIYLNRMGFEESLVIFGDKSKVATFAAVGLLVLLVGCSNSASLSFTNALRRRREVGIRKAAGAGKQSIMQHYLGETVLLSLVACGLALVFQELLLAPVQTLFNISGNLSPGWADYGLLLAIAALIGMINGAYPAFTLSGLRPQSVLETEVTASGKGSKRASALLVGGQFTLTVIFLASALVLYTQLTVAQAQPLGYDYQNLLYFSFPPSTGLPNPSVIANTLENLPGVEAAIPFVTVPPNMNLPLDINAVNLVSRQESETEVQTTRLMIVENFPAMMGIPLLAGRALDENRDRWANSPEDSGRVENALLNRSAAQALGFATPVLAVDQVVYLRGNASGNQVDTPVRIVGVLEDNLYSSIHRRPVPEIYAHPAEISYAQYMLRYDSSSANDVQQRVTALLEPYGIELYFTFIEDRIRSAYAQERSESRMLLIAAGLALSLSCIGMYGLVAASMARSVKEVGIRKVLGATIRSLLGLFIWRYSRPALLANLIAWPVAGWFVLRWIQRFPYQIDLAWLLPIFLCASLVVLLVSWLTIVAATARAAQRPLSNSLRYE